MAYRPMGFLWRSERIPGRIFGLGQLGPMGLSKNKLVGQMCFSCLVAGGGGQGLLWREELHVHVPLTVAHRGTIDVDVDR